MTDTKQLTHEDISLLIEDTDRRIKENAAQMKETDSGSEEIRLFLKELGLFVREVSLSVKENGIQMEKMQREIRESRKETDRQFKETDKKLGKLGNRLGDFVQEMVRPAVVKLFRERGFDVHEVHPNISVNRNGTGVEVDLFVVNDQQAVAVECKSHLKAQDVKDHLERLEKFKDFFPRYRDVELMGAVAAMVMPDAVARYAYHRGLYVLAQNGEMVEVRNDVAFKPRFW
uniref:DUF3782 domain-containing protein n=1 Tax=Candidatus Kentrum sp. MB TaxID=2138164 RepID=A0A450Y1L0_9GAMM|nr:MAG: hypothetical protein BECKMB1821G_GA0114241_101110 [Candidatus Kentron sp. MB]VFK35431.1 MAG: hypothetical protein BECKMB1821I_GA0114274_11183 [Candidatus Kentron sp. MB]VFK77293.1 MAG: hypothetical protein BECKMB1821H_GA0114242_11202 [Candidatus Kentron sp. MB]